MRAWRGAGPGAGAQFARLHFRFCNLHAPRVEAAAAAGARGRSTGNLSRYQLQLSTYDYGKYTRTK